MQSLFCEGEYMMADSGYVSFEKILLMLKSSHLNSPNPAQTHFNDALVKLWVASEHCNEILKVRFGYLKELRLAHHD